jgi:FAD/FMN-containing dehydrogenase
MRPYLIAYPRMDSDDIPPRSALPGPTTSASVARSGGHQYCGLSSGGDDTVLLSMDLYKAFGLKTVGDKTFARVGVGTPLTDVAAAFKENGGYDSARRVSLASRSGGHAQSGGYGHLLRSYGLALDHVLEFKIYTSDGTLRTGASPASPGQEQPVLGRPGRRPGQFRHSDRSYLRVHP